MRPGQRVRLISTGEIWNVVTLYVNAGLGKSIKSAVICRPGERPRNISQDKLSIRLKEPSPKKEPARFVPAIVQPQSESWEDKLARAEKRSQEQIKAGILVGKGRKWN